MERSMNGTWSLGVMASALSEDLRESPRLARVNGFSGIGLDAVTPRLDLTRMEASGLRELRRIVAAQDQAIAGVRADAGRLGLGPGADVDRVLAQLDRSMQVCAGLGTPLLCVDLGPLPQLPEAATPKPKIRPEEAGLILIPGPAEIEPVPEPAGPAQPSAAEVAFAAQLDAALAELGRRADRYGVTVAMRSELAGFGALERALKGANCPWFGVELDPVALLRDAWGLDEVFSRLGGEIRSVRGRDAIVGADRRTKAAAVGQGGTDWGALLSALDEAGFHGWILVDPVDLPSRMAGAVAARDHLARAMGK